MAADAPVQLLASPDRRQFGRVSVVRITPNGTATRRESLFDSTVVTRLWSGVASLASRRRSARRPAAAAD